MSQGGNFLQRYPNVITGFLIIVALIALGLSIAAFATKCKSGFEGFGLGGSLENFGNLGFSEGGGADCEPSANLDWGTPQDPWFNGGGIEAGSPWQGQKNEPVIDCAEACGAAKGCTMFKSNGTYCGTWFKDGPSATAACAWAKAGDQCDETSIATPTKADWTKFQNDPAFGPQDLNSVCSGTQCAGIPVKDGQCAPVWSPPSS